MRNFVIGCIVLFAMAGTACHKDSKPHEPSQQDATRQKTDVGSKTHGPLQEVAVDLGGGVKLDLVLIPAGSFTMGDDAEKSAHKVTITEPFYLGKHLVTQEQWEAEKSAHKVTITKPFYLGKYLVAQEQWESVMGTNPSYFKSPKNPVEMVSWEDCQKFLKRLNDKVGGGKFQLPTEAQWEYACRAGSKTRYCFGDDASKLGEYAWNNKNSAGKTHPVGEKKPNAWGLYDMHGNVWEWCQDWYDAGYYAKSPTDDPTGAATGSDRVNRGGGWSCPAWGCRSAYRGSFVSGGQYFDLGFRVSRVPADK